MESSLDVSIDVMLLIHLWVDSYKINCLLHIWHHEKLEAIAAHLIAVDGLKWPNFRGVRSHTHSFVQVTSFINRKHSTVVFLSSEQKSLSLCSALINSNATVITPNNSVQATFYYKLQSKLFLLTISRFIQINNVKL